ncbi:SMI1/KNR4 family protein [Xanthomonas sp. SI]|uniref:SMI1/KNR4 family protein n=1 Tax=Xanthomonas sp. SI TaxID=2724123 RepID=UPI001861E597|nr:SMI1/KNR4 family protein [Xanthomonas sp. SI]QNH14286.1 hypothetical protein HEP75_03755 [Xanthomonas sp. SI]
MRCKAACERIARDAGTSLPRDARAVVHTLPDPQSRVRGTRTSALPIAAIVARCTHRSLDIQAVQDRDDGHEPVLPASRLLPFANDCGGNFFCLDLDTGAVRYFTTDTFDIELSPEQNQAHSERPLCPDFLQFVQGLIDEEDADEE